MGRDIDVVRRAYAAFARRDVDRMLALLDAEFELHTVTGEETGRSEPYRGPDGMRSYFSDQAAVWDELRLVAHDFDQRGEWVVVTGRVYARRGGQVIDSSAGWHWQLRNERILHCRVFRSSEEALATAPAAIPI